MDDACNKFRAYLHKSGVSEALMASITSLYNQSERPANATEYLRQNLPPVQMKTISGLTSELEDLQREIDALKKMLEQLRNPPPRSEGSDAGSEQKSVDSSDTKTEETEQKSSGEQEISEAKPEE